MPFVRGHYRRTSSGLTYVAPYYRRSIRDVEFLVRILVVALALVAFVVYWLVSAVIENTRNIGIAAVCVGIFGFFGYLFIFLRQRRLEDYIDLTRKLASRQSLSPREQQRLNRLGSKIQPTSQSRNLAEEEIYREAVARMLLDGRVDDDEVQLLAELERRFTFDPHEAERLKMKAFIEMLAHADARLEGRHRTIAMEIGVRLGLARQEIEQAFLAELRHRRGS